MTRAATDGSLADAYDPMSAEVKQDPERYWAALRPVQSVHHFTLPPEVADVISANPLAAKPTTDFFSVLRYADVRNLLMNPKMFSSTEGPGPERMVPMGEGGVLLFADDPVHIRQRRLAAKAFTPNSVSELIPRIQNTADDLIDAVLPRATIPDYLALVGDSADGFPGLPGWGAKSAAAVLARWHHVEEVPPDPRDWDVVVRGAAKLATTGAGDDGDDLGELVFEIARLLLHHTNFEGDYIYPELTHDEWRELMKETVRTGGAAATLGDAPSLTEVTPPVRSGGSVPTEPSVNS